MGAFIFINMHDLKLSQTLQIKEWKSSFHALCSFVGFNLTMKVALIGIYMRMLWENIIFSYIGIRDLFTCKKLLNEQLTTKDSLLNGTLLLCVKTVKKNHYSIEFIYFYNECHWNMHVHAHTCIHNVHIKRQKLIYLLTLEQTESHEYK